MTVFIWAEDIIRGESSRATLFCTTCTGYNLKMGSRLGIVERKQYEKLLVFRQTEVKRGLSGFHMDSKSQVPFLWISLPDLLRQGRFSGENTKPRSNSRISSLQPINMVEEEIWKIQIFHFSKSPWFWCIERALAG